MVSGLTAVSVAKRAERPAWWLAASVLRAATDCDQLARLNEHVRALDAPSRDEFGEALSVSFAALADAVERETGSRAPLPPACNHTHTLPLMRSS